MLTQIEFYDKDALKNILAVITLKPDKVVYFYDKEIKDMNYFVSLYKCFKKHIPNVILEKYPVDINSIQDVYEKTKKIIQENDKCIIELTGGSELMMIGGYKAGFESNTKMVYTDIARGLVINIDDKDDAVKTSNLTLSDFIDAKGASVIGNSHHEPKEEMYEKIVRMSNILFENLKGWRATCGFVQTAMANSSNDELELKSRSCIFQRDGKKVMPDRNILHGFLKNGFIKELNYTSENIRFVFQSKEAKGYMINYGVWLEMFVFISAKKAGVFDDVKLGAMIDWNVYDGTVVTGNEIDVLISDNAMPVFISCKLRDADTAAINELLITKKRLGGWFSKGIIVTFGNDKSNKTGTYKRAQELGIQMLDKEDIMSKNFGERLVKVIKGHDVVNLKWKNI